MIIFIKIQKPLHIHAEVYKLKSNMITPVKQPHRLLFL